MQWHNSVSIVSDSDALQKCMTQSKLNEFCGQHKTKTNQYWFVHIAMGKVGNKIDEIYCYYNKLSQPTIPNEWKSSVLMKAHPSSNYDDDDDDGGGVGGVMVMMLYLPDDAHLHQLVCPNKTPICQPLFLSLSLSLFFSSEQPLPVNVAIRRERGREKENNFQIVQLLQITSFRKKTKVRQKKYESIKGILR